MQLWGALALIILFIWGLVWFVTNFWPWILGVGVTWLALWFIWPDFKFWWKVDRIRSMRQSARHKADWICQETIEEMERIKKGNQHE